MTISGGIISPSEEEGRRGVKTVPRTTTLSRTVMMKRTGGLAADTPASTSGVSVWATAGTLTGGIFLLK